MVQSCVLIGQLGYMEQMEQTQGRCVWGGGEVPPMAGVAHIYVPLPASDLLESSRLEGSHPHSVSGGVFNKTGTHSQGFMVIQTRYIKVPTANRRDPQQLSVC